MLRRFCLILLGASLVTGGLFFSLRQLNLSNSDAPPIPPVPEETSVQFK